MLSDDELQALRDIERRLRWNSPQLVQLFQSVDPQPHTNHRRRAGIRVLLAAAALAGLTLRGPRMLTEVEIRIRQRRPLPRTAPRDTSIAYQTDPLSGPGAPTAPIGVADSLVSPSVIDATPLCRAA